MPVYTVALGTDGGTVEARRYGGPAPIPVPPDPATLQVAEPTGGSFFDAADADALQSVYDGSARRSASRPSSAS